MLNNIQNCERLKRKVQFWDEIMFVTNLLWLLFLYNNSLNIGIEANIYYSRCQIHSCLIITPFKINRISGVDSLSLHEVASGWNPHPFMSLSRIFEYFILWGSPTFKARKWKMSARTSPNMSSPVSKWCFDCIFSLKWS